MPYGSRYTSDSTVSYIGGHLSGYELDIIVVLLVIIIIMLAYLIFKRPKSDIEIAKLEKDTLEIKETVKELKKKWDEID